MLCLVYNKTQLNHLTPAFKTPDVAIHNTSQALVYAASVSTVKVSHNSVHNPHSEKELPDILGVANPPN